MRSTVLASMSPFVKRSRTFSAADHFGASAAHHSLLEHALRYGATDEVHFLLNEDQRRACSSAIDELNGHLSSPKAFTHPLTSLPHLLALHSYVFLTRLGDWLKPAQARLALGQHRFPICAILHSVMLPNPIFAYSNLLISCSEEDYVVTTSSDGATALRNALEQAQDFLAKTVSIGSLKMPRTIQIPLGIADEYGPLVAKGAARNLLSLGGGDSILLYFGRLSRTDKADLDPLLVALSRLASSLSHVKLILAGQDLFSNYRTDLEASARRLGVTDRVLIVPNCSPYLKNLLYTAADIFVSPVDNVQETFGITILEAMAMGLPVVSTDWCGYRDLVIDQQTGFLCPSTWYLPNTSEMALYASCDEQAKAESALAECTVVDIDYLTRKLHVLITDKSLRTQFGKAGLARVNHFFRWSKLMPAYADLWHEMAAARPRDNRQFRPVPDFARIFSTYPSSNGNAQVASQDHALANSGVPHYPTNQDNAAACRHMLFDAADTLAQGNDLKAGKLSAREIKLLKKGSETLMY